jgi:hypothetical protein
MHARDVTHISDRRKNYLCIKLMPNTEDPGVAGSRILISMECQELVKTLRMI